MNSTPSWSRRVSVAMVLACLGSLTSGCSDSSTPAPAPLRVGVAAIPITPCGANPEWDGPVTASGVWGEVYTDANGNGRFDVGESFTDDPRNESLDAQSKGKYDGIYMAGF